MWHCPNCGEQIDDVFDACWKCGTTQDGTRAADFQAEGNNSDTLDSRLSPAEPGEEADDAASAPDVAKPGRIVELRSAANAIEAYAIQDLLKMAGISSHVVGEFLATAAGWLPLGETIAPRIWVREEDEARARAIIDQQIDRPRQKAREYAERNEPAEVKAGSEEERPPLAFAIRFRWLGQVLSIVGLACVLCGTSWALLNWAMMRQYSGTTQGTLVRYRPRLHVSNGPSPEIPLPSQPATIYTTYEAQYAFVVQGKTYYSKDTEDRQLLHHVPIHYDPHHPATNFAGSLTPPRSILAWALGTGGFLWLIGFYWCSNRRRSQVTE